MLQNIKNNTIAIGLQDMRFNTIIVHRLDPTGIMQTEYSTIRKCSCSSRAHGTPHR